MNVIKKLERYKELLKKADYYFSFSKDNDHKIWEEKSQRRLEILKLAKEVDSRYELLNKSFE